MENSTKDLTEQLNDEFTRAVLPVTIIVGIEVVFGFFGNLLVIYVFLFYYRVCTFRYFVLCLAFIDITCCMTTMPGEMVTQLYWYMYPVRELCKTKSFFNVFTVTAEALCLVTIAFDRYRKVCRPFGWQLKPRVAKYLCGVYCIIALFVALPTPFLWGLRSARKIYENESISVTLCEKDQTFEKTDYPIGYISTVAAAIMILLILMFIQYVFVAMKLLKERRHRMGSGKSMVNNTPNMCSPAHSTNENPDTSQNSNDNVSGCDNEVERDFSTNEDSDKPRDKSEIKITDLHNNRNTREKRAFKRNVPKRVRRKTLIMFILTVTFIITTITYFVLVTLIASSKDILQYLTDGQKTVYFLFLRFYFINHVINPVVYGLLDPQFKGVMGRFKSFITNKSVFPCQHGRRA
ncbi:cholecystokinin receptor type A-like [Mercenaria mercenaria]|uniref:cholecystokinin receptor type A-like n=1 Tax=Mercenaria mercenaria TaxID=6596 RepID=UPI00234F9D2E|nr:cholecystokinin receptor type A-like [Mercenaria mercenaria]